MMIGLISIYKRDSLKVIIKIYHQPIGTIIKDKFNSLFLCIVFSLRIALEKMAVKYILMICIDGKIWQFHLIIADINVDYKEQMVIINIKLGM